MAELTMEQFLAQLTPEQREMFFKAGGGAPPPVPKNEAPAAPAPAQTPGPGPAAAPLAAAGASPPIKQGPTPATPILDKAAPGLRDKVTQTVDKLLGSKAPPSGAKAPEIDPILQALQAKGAVRANGKVMRRVSKRKMNQMGLSKAERRMFNKMRMKQRGEAKKAKREQFRTRTKDALNVVDDLTK